jgi:hypothetical protein
MQNVDIVTSADLKEWEARFSRELEWLTNDPPVGSPWGKRQAGKPALDVAKEQVTSSIAHIHTLMLTKTHIEHIKRTQRSLPEHSTRETRSDRLCRRQAQEAQEAQEAHALSPKLLSRPDLPQMHSIFSSAPREVSLQKLLPN